MHLVLYLLKLLLCSWWCFQFITSKQLLHRASIVEPHIDFTTCSFDKFFYVSSSPLLPLEFATVTPLQCIPLRPTCVTEYVSECGNLAESPQQHCHQVSTSHVFTEFQEKVLQKLGHKWSFEM